MVYRLKTQLEAEAKYYGTLYQECGGYKVPDTHAKAMGYKDLADIKSYYDVKTSMLKRMAVDIKDLESSILGLDKEHPNPFGQ